MSNISDAIKFILTLSFLCDLAVKEITTFPADSDSVRFTVWLYNAPVFSMANVDATEIARLYLTGEICEENEIRLSNLPQEDLIKRMIKEYGADWKLAAMAG